MKKQKINNFPFKKYAFKIAYLGKNFFGYERQIGSQLRTVESELFKTLKQVNLIENRDDISKLDYSKSGRTDKKVSAAGNVFSILLKISPKEQKNLLKRINSALPNDIVILSYSEVDQIFDARRSTISREYFYYFFEQNLDFEKMQKTCEILIGEHDFKNFCKFNESYLKSGTVRKIFKCNIEKIDTPCRYFKLIKFVIEGSSFLWHMVRNIIAVLKVVGRGQIEPKEVKKMLDINNNNEYMYTLDDPEGLILNQCKYENFEFPTPQENDQQYILPFFSENFQNLKIKSQLITTMKNYYEENINNEQELILTKKESPKAFSINKKKIKMINSKMDQRKKKWEKYSKKKQEESLIETKQHVNLKKISIGEESTTQNDLEQSDNQVKKAD